MRLALLLFFLLIPNFLFAAELSLKRAVTLALERNPDYRRAVLAVGASKEKEREAFSRMLFTLSFDYSYTRLNEEQRVRTKEVTIPPLVPGMQPVTIKPGDIVVSKQNVYNYQFTFFQPLFTGGALSESRRIAQIGVDVERLREREARLDLVFKVKEAYFNALKAKKLLEVARETVKLLEAHYRDAEAFYRQGITPKVDLLRARVALSRARQRLTDAEATYRIALSALAVLLRDPLDVEYELEDVKGIPPFGLSFSQCAEEALARRPVVRAVKRQVEMARHYVKLEEADYYPKLYLVGTYKKQGDTPDCTGDGLRDAEVWSIGGQIKWTFFEWGKTRHRVKRAKIEELRAVELERSVEDKVLLEVREAYLRLISARERLEVTREQVGEARENYKNTRERYREQIDTTTDVIDAQVFLTQAENSYYSALYDYNIAYSRLMRVMGRDE